MSPAGLNRGDSRWHTDCVRRTRTQPLICVGCSVHHWVPCSIYKGGFFEISFVVDTHLPCFEAIAYVLPHFDALTHVVVRVSLAFIFAICIREAYLSKLLLWINLHIFSMVRRCLWKMCATPVACINETAGLFSSAAVVPQSKYIPTCVAGQSLCHTK